MFVDGNGRGHAFAATCVAARLLAALYGFVEEELPGRLAAPLHNCGNSRHGGLRRDDGVKCRALTPIIMSARRRLSEDIKPHAIVSAELRIAHGRTELRESRGGRPGLPVLLISL